MFLLLEDCVAKYGKKKLEVIYSMFPKAGLEGNHHTLLFPNIRE
jgi:hypothetical protein